MRAKEPPARAERLPMEVGHIGVIARSRAPRGPAHALRALATPGVISSPGGPEARPARSAVLPGTASFAVGLEVALASVMQRLAPWIVALVSLASLTVGRRARSDGPTDPPDKGGTRPGALSLPTGPGSVQGLGERVVASPSTGAAQLVVPIELPAGPPGVTPALALRYDSRQGNGPLGVGWGLSLPSIARRTDRGLPRYGAGGAPADELLWNGERLVEVTPGVYRLRVEGEFTRIVALPSGYRADRKDGVQIFLGVSSASQIEEGGRVFRWLAERWVDPHGDEADCRYLHDGGQAYPVELRYGRAGQPSASVSLAYEPRPDALPDARPGFVVTTALRLHSLETLVSGARVRQLTLRYALGPGLSTLAGIELCGTDDGTCLPELGLGVGSFDPTAAELVALAPPGVTLEDPDAALVDVDGDSLPDVVRLRSDGASLWRNLGPLGFGSEEPLQGAPGVELSQVGVAFQDMDGDGRADLLMALGAGGMDGLAYLPAAGAGLGAPVEAAGPSALDPGDPALRWLDLDGDGKVDALRGDADGWTAWFNLGGGQFSAPVALPSPAPWLSLADPAVRLGDMNDDGLVDLVVVHSGSVQILLNLGFGLFAPPVAMVGAPEVLGDDARLALGDADGDGLPDLYYVAPGRLSLWRNQADGSFGPELRIAAAPAYEPTTTAVRLVDLEGAGTSDVVYSGEDSSGPFLWRLSLCPGGRPLLLQRFANGFGGQQAFSYRTTGALMGEAAANGTPWSSFAPFPLALLTEQQASDGRSAPMRIDRDYRDPYFDGAAHAFRGFGSSSETHPGDAHAAGLSIERHFHTGQGEDRALVGQPLSEASRADDGTLLATSGWTTAPVVVATGLSGEPCAFAAQLLRVDERWEGAASPSTRRLRQRFDAHGNVVESWEDGTIDGLGAAPVSRHWRHGFAEDETRWRLGLWDERELVDGSGARIALERRCFDGPDFVGLPQGQFSRGDLTRREAWVEGSRFDQVERRALDAFGNPRAILDGEGRRRELDYDAARSIFPVEERQFPLVGPPLRFRTVVDPILGEPVLFEDAGGQVTRYGRDGLGRLTSIERPGDPAGDPAELIDWRLDLRPAAVIVRRRPAPGGPFTIVSASLVDGLLRPLAKIDSAEGGRFAVSGLVDRDARGGVDRRYEPFFSSGTADLAIPQGTGVTESFVDGLSRPIRRLLPAGEALRWSYGPSTVDSWDALATAGAAWPVRRQVDPWGQTLAIFADEPGQGEAIFRFDRDAAGRVVRRTTPESLSAVVTRDGLGRIVALADPDAGKLRWSLDRTGKPVERRDAAGHVLRWSYDGAGRLLEEDDAAGRLARYRYDVPGPGECGAATPARLLSVQDRTGTTCFGYDVQSRLVTEEVTLGEDDLTTSFAYDAADRLIGVGYPDGSSVRYRYEGRSLAPSLPGLLDAASYDAAGDPIQRSFANGLSLRVDRDIEGRELGADATVGPTDLVSLHYRLLASGAPAELDDETGATTYQLDSLERLVGETGPEGARAQSYDAEGRITGRWATPADPRLPGTGLGYGQNAGPHALTQDAAGAYRYDAAGERIASRGLALGYDDEGRLLGASAPDFQASYGYAFDGERRRRDVAWKDGRTLTARSFGPFVELRDGVLWKHVLLGAERIASLPGALPDRKVALGVGCGSVPGPCSLAPVWLILAALGLRRRRR